MRRYRKSPPSEFALRLTAQEDVTANTYKRPRGLYTDYYIYEFYGEQKVMVASHILLHDGSEVFYVVE